MAQNAVTWMLSNLTLTVSICAIVLVQLVAISLAEPTSQDVKMNSDDKDEPTEEKRAWNKLQAAWGKRAWQNLQSTGWGKRTMFPYLDWRDRTTNDRWYLNDKRAWQNLHSAGWGKRVPLEVESDVPDDEYNQYAQLMDPSVVYRAVDADYLDGDVDKRAWKNLNSAWGKREPNKWSRFKGSWGKRQPAWNNLKGLWGRK